MSTFTKAQQLAIAAKGNVLVSAGAGTGKTRTVVERCVRLIVEECCSLENILMVTFTEAAAAEMRARLRKELEKAQLAGPSLHLEEQLALLDTAHISTLHSFCLQLIRDEFHHLGIDPQVSVLDEVQTVPLIHETFDALFDACYRNEAPLASGVLELVRRARGSDERVRALVLRLHCYTQSRPDASRWIEQQLVRFREAEPTEWREWLVREFVRWREDWLPRIQKYSECANVATCFEAISRCQREPSRAEIADALNCIRIADKETEWERGTKGKFRAPLEEFFDDAAFLGSLTRTVDGRDPLADDWQWSRQPLITLIEFASAFTDAFTRAKRAQGGVDFADLEQLALKLLCDGAGQPTEIARTFREKFAHVFVDECQDINAAQDAIIRAVSRDGENGNRFLVGDVKQSIYRFRLADPTIFREYERAWRGSSGGQRIALSDNFRSREGVLDFVNSLFSDIMREDLGGIVYDADAKLRFGEKTDRASLPASGEPRVELHVIHKVKRESGEPDDIGGETVNGDAGATTEDLLAVEKEARLIALRLRELREGRHEIWDEAQKATRLADWRDMVVLLRSPNTRVEAFAKEFTRVGVPLAAQRAGFYTAIEIQDLLNVLRLLDNPLQDIPLVAVLRSPIGGLSLDELAAVRIAADGERREPFYTAANHVFYKGCAADVPLGTTAREKLATLFKRLAHWRQLAQQTSLSQCIESMLADTHYEALLLTQPRGRERVANVRRLLDLARQYDPFQRQGLFRFIRFVDEQQDAELDQESAPVESENAVRLMSIHASKGLEFPIVVVGCLGGQFNFKDLREEILLDTEMGPCPKVSPPRSEEQYPSLTWWLANRRAKIETLGEELRLLYVAMTRARDTLILTAYDKSKTAEEQWGDGPTVSSDELGGSRSYFGWVRSWLNARTKAADWQSETEGSNALLRWRRVAETDGRFGTDEITSSIPATVNSNAVPFDLARIRQRLAWRYPHCAATSEPAKTNVSDLRRRATEEDEEVRFIFRSRGRTGGLSAAEVGSAHHAFLQSVDLQCTSSAIDLRNEAERLVKAGLVSSEQRASLDFNALLNFWTSKLGRDVCANAKNTHRELPFTIRLRGRELRDLGLPMQTQLDDETIVVQGVADLVVLLRDALWLVDFKTDRGDEKELLAKKDLYRPQIECYALALGRIYCRRVTRRSLHFLAAGKTIEV